MRSTPARHFASIKWRTHKWSLMPSWACKAELTQDEFGRWWVRYFTDRSYGPRRFVECMGPWSILDPYAWFAPGDPLPGEGLFIPCRETARLKRYHDKKLYEQFHGTVRRSGGYLPRLHVYHPRGSAL